ncbi:uncharacterized protein AKAW2_31470S [Aspergillus luchuensis]|uniref:Uncharacterized protein n=1 Tax=Aspergillus kawachii TaxID=1069201 RepID=A0A7R7ZYH5_ASPKA|nr:uncharacterized protein AKAW2_31470S [Aspergillus luchuensis]BCR98151.1 hypothetical protein AKAW2_31470S [Aspergillus luchuensis]
MSVAGTDVWWYRKIDLGSAVGIGESLSSGNFGRFSMFHCGISSILYHQSRELVLRGKHCPHGVQKSMVPVSLVIAFPQFLFSCKQGIMYSSFPWSCLPAQNPCGLLNMLQEKWENRTKE